MWNDSWTSVAKYADRISAEAILGLLESDDVPCYIASNELIPGVGSEFSVCVPARFTAQATQLLEANRVSDAELTEIALRQPREDATDE